VLKLLHKLPIDLNQEGRKEQLKKSELGRYVMFYSKLPEENLANRQLARALVEKWSRPIFDQYRERERDEEMQVGTPPPLPPNAPTHPQTCEYRKGEKGEEMLVSQPPTPTSGSPAALYLVHLLWTVRCDGSGA
jgi:hypothetical protein